ncbi:adenosine deaminase editase [Irpex rosettiformis]|uniref:Adenosine deaminase editase n=1 Tax=Irpex rosettiformis TaxID=378272 RepID=A0ACB8UDI9_9APHY|nr:adenosine deaminase editase [Irpex rosettiformis]
MTPSAPDEIAALVHSHYASLSFKPPPNQFTILAAFVLLAETRSPKLISLATGSKCLPASKLQIGGDFVHDSHAEILARRGAIRFFLEEIGRANESAEKSEWIEPEEGKFKLKEGVDLLLYVSTPPCGDASTRYLASFQDEAMAALKDSSAPSELAAGTAARGRDGYSLHGVLRTKPGRADSPPTLCMSCSDKIASWSVLGIQGALASMLLGTIYIDCMIIGEVDEGMQDMVREDCERALWKRLETIDESHLPATYRLHRPRISFTAVPFVHAKVTMQASLGDNLTSCNDSLCWIADSPKSPEVLINGLKRGVSPKHRSKPKLRPLLSKISLFELYQRTTQLCVNQLSDSKLTYLEAKRAAIDYQTAKRALRVADGAPFAGWLKTGSAWEEFRLQVHSPTLGKTTQKRGD